MTNSSRLSSRLLIRGRLFWRAVKATPVSDSLIQLNRLGFVNAFLVREEDGFTLVDTTLSGNAGAIVEAAGAAGLPIVRIALTTPTATTSARLTPQRRAARRRGDHGRASSGWSSRRAADPDEPQAKVRGSWPSFETPRVATVVEDDQAAARATPATRPATSPDERSGTVIAGDAFDPRGHCGGRQGAPAVPAGGWRPGTARRQQSARKPARWIRSAWWPATAAPLTTSRGHRQGYPGRRLAGTPAEDGSGGHGDRPDRAQHPRRQHAQGGAAVNRPRPRRRHRHRRADGRAHKRRRLRRRTTGGAAGGAGAAGGWRWRRLQDHRRRQRRDGRGGGAGATLSGLAGFRRSDGFPAGRRRRRRRRWRGQLSPGRLGQGGIGGVWARRRRRRGVGGAGRRRRDLQSCRRA